MRLRDLINEVNKDLDDELDAGDITGWLNRALDDISPFSNNQKMATINLVPGQKLYPVPDDFIKTVQIVDESYPCRLVELQLGDLIGFGYKVIGRDIVIQPTPKEPQSLELYYEARLPHLVNQEDEPQIRVDFHDILVLYAVARARYQDEEESLQMNAMNEYQLRKREFIYECRKSPMYSIELIY